MVDFDIRSAEPDDADAISEIMNQRYVAANTLQLLYSHRQLWRERLANPNLNHHLVAVSEGMVIGSGGLTRFERRRAHVGSIGMSVHQAYHGQGVGSALVEALLDLADNWYNLRRIELEVYTDNQPAINLYKKYGFEIEGTLRAFAFREGHYTDAYYMARLHESPGLIQQDSGEGR